MTVLAMEGFEHGDITLLDYTDSMNDSNISSSYARIGGKGLYFGSLDAMQMKFPDGYPTITIGFAYKSDRLSASSNSLPSINTSYCPFLFHDEVYYNFGFQYISPNILQCFTVISGGTGVTVGSPFSIDVGRWYYFEIKCTIHATNGLIMVKRDGQTILDETGLDTYYNTANFRKINFYSAGSYYYLDDIYVTDGEFLGDVRIRGFVPDANGSINDFTPSAGSNYQCVDEIPSTDDTDYVESDIQGDIDLYGITTGTLATVKAIKVQNQTRKTDAGSREVRSIVRSNGSNYNGTTVPLSDSYTNVCKHIWNTDPDDSNAWNQSKLEAAEFGLEIVT